MRRRRSTLPLRQSTTPESIQSFLLSYPLHFQADLARNILGLRGALRNSPIGAGLIGRSRRATDVGLHPTPQAAIPVYSTGSYSARTNSVTPVNWYMFSS